MGKITDRIFERANQLQLQQKDIAKATGASNPTVNNWFNHSSEPSIKYLENLAYILNVSIQWLVTGIDISPSITVGKNTIKKAPILSLSEAVDFEAYLISKNSTKEFEFYADKGFGSALFWIRMKNDNSMFPTIADDDLILIDTQKEARSGYCVLTLIEGDTRATLRRFRICYDEKANKEYFQLIADNGFYEPVDTRRTKFTVIGVAVKYEKYLI